MTGKSEHFEPEAIEERVRAIAYRLWEEDGCPEGKSEEHWLKAERIVVSEMAKVRGKDASEPLWLKRDAKSGADDALPEDIPGQAPRRQAGRSAA